MPVNYNNQLVKTLGQESLILDWVPNRALDRVLDNGQNNTSQPHGKTPGQITCQIIRSSRRSLCLQIKNGKVLIRCPNRLSEAKIRDFVIRKQGWLMAKLDLMHKKQAKETLEQSKIQSNQTLIFGQVYTHHTEISDKLRLKLWKTELKKYVEERFPALATAVGVKLVDKTEYDQNKAELALQKKNNHAKTPNRKLKSKPKIGSKSLLVDKLSQSINWFFGGSQTPQTQPKSKILKQKADPQKSDKTTFFHQIKYRANISRWGSCTSTGIITFSIRLASKPKLAIDYVIIHELCHLLQMNHSPAFWAEVERASNQLGLDWRAGKALLRS